MGIASNSVSTLVKQLTRLGLIERSADPLDGRAASLSITPQAESWLKEMGSTREDAVARAWDALADSERESIENSLPALRKLADRLLQQ